MLRFKTVDAPATAREDLLKVKLDMNYGPIPYMIEIRQQMVLAASVPGNDVQPSTVIRKVLANIPEQMATRPNARNQG